MNQLKLFCTRWKLLKTQSLKARSLVSWALPVLALSLLFGLIGGSTAGMVAQSSDIQAELSTALARAEEFEAKDQFYNAIEVWQRALKENPNDSRIYFGIARNYMRIGRYKEALDFVERARLLANQDYQVGILKSRILMGLKRYDEARELLLQLKNQNTSYEIDLALAEIYAVLGNVASSISYLSPIQEIASSDLNYLLTSVMVYEEAGQIEASDRFLRQALDSHYNEAVAHKVAAGYYLRRGRYAAVQEEIDIIKRLGIDTLEQRLLGLKAAYLKGDYQLAVNLAETIVSLYPKNSQAWFLLGLAYSNIAQYLQALDALATARRIEPNDELASIVISEILRLRYPYPSKWHTQESKRYIERAKVKRQRLLYDAALQDYRLALQLDPLNKQNWMAFANVFRNRGNYAKYLDKLITWRQYGMSPSGNSGDSSVATETSGELDRLIKIYQASQRQSVAQNWGLDQYSYANNFYPLQIFLVKGHDSGYTGAPKELGSYFTNILQWYEQPAVVADVQIVEDRLEAQQVAYLNKNNDYYITLEFTEQGENFRAELSLYLSSSGRQIASFTTQDVSKGKIYTAFAYLARQLHDLFPKKGRIVQTTLNKAVISQGSLDGAEPGQKWLILPEEVLSQSENKPFAEYEVSQVIGVLTIEESDEKVSEGSIKLESVIKPMKIGYIALLLPDNEENNEATQTEEQPNLPRKLQPEPNINLQNRLFELA